MAPTKNLSLLFKSIPPTMPVPGEHLAVEDVPLDLSTPAPKGGLIVAVHYASFEPYLRGRMRGPQPNSYVPPFEPNEPITSMCIAEVVQSDHADYPAGALIRAFLPVAQYAVLPGPMLPHIRLEKVKSSSEGGPADLRDYLGALAGPGITAYASLYEIGKPKKGETLFVSSAAGGVGQIAGQLAKREGLKVFGSVGTDEKLKFITEELGFDGGFNYKKESPAEGLERLIPDGIDIYFDNVGGPHLSAALDNMNNFGRIVACGMISQYNLAPSERHGVTNLQNVVARRLTMRGFIVTDPDMLPYFGPAAENMTKWLGDGSLKAKTYEVDGMERAAEACVGVFKGDGLGKAVLKIK